MTTTDKTETMQDIESDNDFSVVEWKVASPEVSQRLTDYGSLEAVKVLLTGQVLEVPKGTQLNRLYRWLNKNGYSLRRHRTKDAILIWVEASNKEEAAPQIQEEDVVSAS